MLNLFIVLFLFLFTREYVLLNEELFFIFSFTLFFVLAFVSAAEMLTEVLDQKAEEVFGALALSYKTRKSTFLMQKQLLVTNLQFLRWYRDLLYLTLSEVHLKNIQFNNQRQSLLNYFFTNNLKLVINSEFLLQRAFLQKVGEQSLNFLLKKLSKPIYFARQFAGTEFLVFDKYVYGFTPFILEHMSTHLPQHIRFLVLRSRFLLYALALRLKKPFLLFV